jgi:serine/threonine-protein kinase
MALYTKEPHQCEIARAEAVATTAGSDERPSVADDRASFERTTPGADSAGSGDAHPIDPHEPDLESGTRAGEYVIQSKIGQGGYGSVYRAVHPLIGKHAAVKVLLRRLSFDRRFTSRFVAEARAVNQIRHPHIIDIFSFGVLPDGRQYHIMELLEGRSLDSLIAERGRLTPEETLEILEPLASALDAAHAKGIAHRDLKPANVFLAKGFKAGWYPKLLDFGIAKLMSQDIPRDHQTVTGAAVGTPYYMSPEQCRGTGVDKRTDIYSFGVMTYEMLTGRLPFRGRTAVDTFLAHVQQQPVPLDAIEPTISEALSRLVLSMLDKDPDKRPQDLADVVRMFRGALAAPTIPPGPPAILHDVPALLSTSEESQSMPLPSSQKTSSNRLTIVMAVTAAIVAASAGVVLIASLQRREPPARIEAPAPTSASSPPQIAAPPVAEPPPVTRQQDAPSAVKSSTTSHADRSAGARKGNKRPNRSPQVRAKRSTGDDLPTWDEPSTGAH